MAAVCVLVSTLFLFADFKVVWLPKVSVKDIYYYNKRDFFVVVLFIIPAIVSHLVTIWGHYYKADDIFQEAIAKCSTATAKERKRISIWERHDPWWGFTVKYWLLVGVSVLLNLVWFVIPVMTYLPPALKTLGTYGAITGMISKSRCDKASVDFHSVIELTSSPIFFGCSIRCIRQWLCSDGGVRHAPAAGVAALHASSSRIHILGSPATASMAGCRDDCLGHDPYGRVYPLLHPL